MVGGWLCGAQQRLKPSELVLALEQSHLANTVDWVAVACVRTNGRLVKDVRHSRVERQHRRQRLPFEVLALSEYVDQKFRSGALTLKEPRDGETVTYHDPCRLGRHGGVLNEPRHVLTALGYSLRNTSAHRRDNHCCGGGCAEYVIKRSANIRQRAWEIKRREFDEAGAKQVVTSCENCRINLMIGADNAGWETPITSFAEIVADRLAD